MFLVKDRRFGMDQFVFTNIDPREEGYKGDVLENVSLNYNMDAVHAWSSGLPRPNPRLGRDPNNSSHYKVFKSPEELEESGFQLVHMNTPIVAHSWSEYRKQYYPVPEEFAGKMTQDEWFDFLDEADAAAKIRKKLSQPDDPKPGSSRDEIAEWVAKQHMGADGAVHHIWYLPSGAAEDEIRFLEVSDRFLPEGASVEPLGFGLNVAGMEFKLQVADVTSDQFEKIKRNPADLLPESWKFEGGKSWSRRDLR